MCASVGDLSTPEGRDPSLLAMRVRLHGSSGGGQGDVLMVMQNWPNNVSGV